MSSPSSSTTSWRRDLLCLALVFGALISVELGSASLANPDESRYAEIPREMVASGDWVTPRLDGVVYFEKPPLVYWSVAEFLRYFGPSEWSMRATPALFALAGVLIVYAAGRRLHGRGAGIAAAAVLGTSLLYFFMGRALILDMVVSVLISATLICFLLGISTPAARAAPAGARRLFFYGLYASAALATLAKGLIGLLLPGAVMFLWLLIFNQWRRLRPFYLPTGALLYLAIAAPWHILAALRNPQWAHFYFVHEHWERFTTTDHGRVHPWWYFLPIVLVGLFPWTGFLGCSLKDRLNGGWRTRNENADAWFLVTWAVFIFLFFSSSQSKLIPYILPVLPPLALLIGSWISSFVPQGWTSEGTALLKEPGGAAPRKLRPGLRVFAFGAGLLGTAMLVAVLRPGVIANPLQRSAVTDNAIAAAAILFTGGIVALWLAKFRGARHALVAMVLTTCGLYISLSRAQDEISRIGTKTLAQYFKANAGPMDQVFHYHEFFQDFPFYAERLVGTVEFQSELELSIDPDARDSGRFVDEKGFRARWDSPRRVWAVARKEDVAPLFGDPAFHYNLLAESPNHYLFSNQP